jgi:hypothetical protein
MEEQAVTKPTEQLNCGMRLNIELGAQLLVQKTGADERINATLVGLEPNAYLILRVNAYSFKQLKLKAKDEFTVRYFCLGTAYGFRASALGVIQKPFRLLFLSYPEHIEKFDLRRSKRVTCYIPATAVLKEKAVKGVISDIGTDGCRFNIKLPGAIEPHDVKVVDQIKLAFPLLGMKGRHDFDGIVRNTSQTPELISLGISFDNVDKQIARKIAAYIESVAEYTED